MATQLFSHTQTPIDALVAQIDSGDLSLPDLQRPFVWTRSRVRDLFDSLYRGYPAGYFLFWSASSAVDSHAVAGSEGTRQSGMRMIVDGQQRLTSLYCVVKGKPVTSDDGLPQRIRISFNPLTEEFAVADAARENDPEWLTDISEIWTNQVGVWGFTNAFIDQLAAVRELTNGEREMLGTNLARLAGITGYQFSVLELSADMDIDEVAEVFVRINSKGITLNSADFILTLMSVHTKEARHRLEDFARLAKKPSTGMPSPYNHFHAPTPDELLRVAVGLGLKRGVLQNAYQALRGREPVTKVVSEELRDQNFALLLEAQDKVLDLTSWHEYIVAIKRAGFRSHKMLTSANNFLYGYLIFLIGRHEYGVDHTELREAIARWFFMASLTGRYTGSPESVIEADLRRFADATTADEFIGIIDQVISTQFTDDFWEVTLPDLLDTSAAWSPYLFGYYASLILLDATALFSKMKINDLFDPSQNQPKSPIERHHLFPRAYLAKNGIAGTKHSNRIANFAFVEWADNIEISDSSPAEYFPAFMEKLNPEERDHARFWHALPPGWVEMDYDEFLKDRRSRIAGVVRAGFRKLRDGETPFVSGSPANTLPTVSELLRQMETHHVEFKKSARVSLENDAPEKVINEGVVKTVSAFMNSDGGTLGIGITDDGDILGLQPDLDYKHQDIDGYQNWLSSLLINSIGAGVVGAHVHIRVESAGDKLVCLVDVTPSPKPVYASTTKGKECFYVRIGNTTRQLDGPQIPSYIDSHWPKG